MKQLHPLLLAAKNNGLISADDLMILLRNEPGSIRMVDATYPANPSLPSIGDSVDFDIDDIAAPDALLHTIPDQEKFSRDVGALGIGDDDFVIVYDQTGFVMAASRVWWMFRLFGHDNVAVLDGGLHYWINNDFPISIKNPANTAPKTFTAKLNPELLSVIDEVSAYSQTGSAQIYDARPPERFFDHIPGSKNLPALALMQADRTAISAADFNVKLESLDMNFEAKTILTCGSGVTACANALLMHRAGLQNVAVYDGSWTEWSLVNGQ